MLRKKQGRCWVSERDGKRVREMATTMERTRSFAALTCNSFGKRVGETAMATERRQRRRRKVREWEQSERETETEESQRVRERPRVRGNDHYVCFFKRVRMSDRCFKSCPETEFKELSFYAQKPSSLNSFSALTNRVQWTRFKSPENEFIKLDFWSTWHHAAMSVASKTGNSSTIYSIL